MKHAICVDFCQSATFSEEKRRGAHPLMAQICDLLSVEKWVEKEGWKR